MIDVAVLEQILQNELAMKIFWVAVTLIAAKVMTKIFSSILGRLGGRMERVGWSENTYKLLDKLLRYGVWAAALFVILEIAGLKGSITTALAGAGVMGIAIGFAAKDTLSNFISGIFLYSDQTFNIGDKVEIGGNTGVVTDIHLRKTIIKGYDNSIITIPNSRTAEETVINYSQMPTRRVEIPVGIAYEADIEKAEKVITEGIKKDGDYLKEPAPDVAVNGFGDFSVNLTVRAWIKNEKYLAKKNKLTKIVKGALDTHSVEIPYPKRVVISKKGK